MENDIIRYIAIFLIASVSFILGYANAAFIASKKISRLMDKVTYERQSANKKEIIISLGGRND